MAVVVGGGGGADVGVAEELLDHDEFEALFRNPPGGELGTGAGRGGRSGLVLVADREPGRQTPFSVLNDPLRVRPAVRTGQDRGADR